MNSIKEQLKASDLIEFINMEEGKGINPLASLRVYYANWSYNGFLTNSLTELGAQLKRENPMEWRQLVVRADLFVSGTYLFQNEWDMERTSQPEYFPLEGIKWDHNPTGDPEWMYMLNRHAFLIDVALAYQVTSEVAYLEYIEGFLAKWLRDNPLTDETKGTSWRTIDAGLRLVNWVKVLEILTPSQGLSPQLFGDLVVSIDQHLAYVTDSLSVNRGQSNWAVIEIAGIVTAALAFKELDRSADCLAKALSHLTPALALQIEADGTQREQSFMYHHEVLICLLQLLLLAQRNQLALEPSIEEQAKKMARASALFVKPDGTQSNYGDSDVESMIGILSVAEKILNEPYLIEGMVPEFSPLYDKLFVGLTSRPDFSERLTALPSVSFDNAGLFIMRSSDNQDYTLFKCGPLGGGHGHDDLLHIELYTQGRTVLVDSGRYSYECQRHQRLAYKEGQAHNTIIVDGQNFNAHQEAWETTKVATPINQKRLSQRGAQFTEGGHLGYFDLPDPVLVNRKVIYLDEGFWFISDEISCQKEHQIETSFHFPQSNLTQVSPQKVAYQDEQGLFTIEVLTTDGACEITDCEISWQYNQNQGSQKAIYRYPVAGNHSLTYLLSNQAVSYRKLPVYLEETTLLKDCDVTAYMIETPAIRKYVLIQHREPDQGRRAYCLDGNYVYGRISVVDCKEDGSFLNQVNLY